MFYRNACLVSVQHAIDRAVKHLGLYSRRNTLSYYPRERTHVKKN